MKILKNYLPIILIISLAELLIYYFGQPLFAKSGKFLIWAGQNSDSSQYIMDWYSFSHFIHGLLFFFILSYFFKNFNFKKKLVVSVIIELLWEIVENTPMVINRYREGALALGYSGDTVLNSTCDILFMILGFFFAKRYGWKISLIIIIFLELFTLYFIRDNLTLNIIMLLHPLKSISNWQVGL